MGINLIESIKGEQIFEYKFPEFLNENNEIGNTADDFEVLQVLGNGAFGNVLKVKSKKNLEIYAMKKVDKYLLSGQDEEKYYKNEQIILRKLQSPLVCRCYSIFEDERYLYYVMEFMNNGDLKSYFFANKYLESKIPEENLWDLYFKCISGLLYIHNQGIIHRDIKLDNIFLDDNFNIKIGDFNVSAAINREKAKNFTIDDNQITQMLCNYSNAGTRGYMAPEFKVDINHRYYDQKIDVYSMGISFFILAYGEFPLGSKKDDYFSKNLYSEELNHIIDKMIKEDPTNRYTSDEAYKTIKNIYMQKYVKNSSVKSALNCFYSFKNFRDFFINNDNKNILHKNKESNNNYLNDNKVQMGYSVFESIKSLGGENEYQINSILFDLRKNMENYGLNTKYNEEIQIGKFIFYFLKILNNIFNEVVIDEKNKQLINEIDKDLAFLSSSYTFNTGEEERIFNKVIEVYNKRILSLISRNFINIIKTKRKCMFCSKEGNSFTMLNYIPFNVNILTRNNNANNLNIKDGFKYLLNDEKSFNEQKGIRCKNCSKIQVHKESKSFYHTAKNLIIILNRGENCENKTVIDFDEELILNTEVERYQQIQYQLIGIIEENEDGNYISFTRNENNLWSYNGDKNNVTNFQVVKSLGLETVVALFYYCNKNELILEFNSSKSSSSSCFQEFKNLSLSDNPNVNNSIYNNNINNNSINNNNQTMIRSFPANIPNNVNNLNNMNNRVNINGMNNNYNYNYTGNNINQYPFQNNGIFYYNYGVVNNNYNNQINNYSIQNNLNNNYNFNNNVQMGNYQTSNSASFNINNNFNHM
jgi:serine/threonine protein kinase